ncbi:MAG: Mrp/NBP35 family ATP-binding protein [Actinomycetota bacterium]
MTISEEAVRQALSSVKDPEIGKPLDQIGMLGDVEIAGDSVVVNVLLTVAGCPLKDELVRRVREAVAPVEGVRDVDVRFGIMDPQIRAELASGLKGDIPFGKPDSRTTVIGVSSGKGGVGKSTVTTNLAAALQRLGHNVGVLDADIWGFSVPRMFGLRGQRPVAFDGMIMPLTAQAPPGSYPSGFVKVISIGFFLPNEEDPVVWRGPMLHKALEQFLTDVYWGADLEYLLIDLPPGTGDISLSLATFLPNIGMVVVTTPQPVAQKVAERAANMADKVKQRLLGVVENMSGLRCAHCGEITNLFGEGGGEELAQKLNVPLLGQLPLVQEMREAGDNGVPFVWAFPEHDVTQTYMDVAKRLTDFRPRRRLPVMEIGPR